MCELIMTNVEKVWMNLNNLQSNVIHLIVSLQGYVTATNIEKIWMNLNNLHCNVIHFMISLQGYVIVTNIEKNMNEFEWLAL